MSTDKNLVIIGPSKVGKTALVASLYHASVVLNQQIRQEDYTIEVIPQNQEARDLFSAINTLLKTGAMPFGGSYELRNYHIQMTAPDPSPSFFARIQELFGWDDGQDRCEIFFPDAPGGAVFHSDEEEVDDAGIQAYRKKLVQLMSKSFGLIICLDSSILSSKEDALDQKRMALNFAQWLPGLLAEVLEKQNKSGSDTQRLHIQRVCFVLTKSDLWADQEGKGDQAESVVQNRNAYDHAVDILGRAFFTGFRQFFSQETEFSFFMSSVFGFHQGGIQQRFFEEMEEEDMLTLDEWVPFNVIEPFLTAVDATPPDTYHITKTKTELGK